MYFEFVYVGNNHFGATWTKKVGFIKCLKGCLYVRCDYTTEPITTEFTPPIDCGLTYGREELFLKIWEIIPYFGEKIRF